MTWAEVVLSLIVALQAAGLFKAVAAWIQAEAKVCKCEKSS